MRHAELMRRGAEAAEDIVESVLRHSVRKALDPLQPRDFTTIMDRLTRQVAGAVAGDEQRAMAAALDALDVRWVSMSDRQVDAVVKAANEVLRRRVDKIPAKVELALSVDGPQLAASSRKSTKQRFKLDITADLQQRDKAAEKFARAFTGNYVRDEMGRRVDAISKRARGVVQRGMELGLGSDQIGKNLHQALGNRVARSPAYWRVVAGSYAGHARTFSQISAFDDAGIETWMFEAVLDEATTECCRFYHGRTWATADAVSHAEKLFNLDDPEDITDASPWVRQGTGDDGEEFLWVRKGDKRVRIATIERGGSGKADDVGTFTRARSSSQLLKLGAVFPPLHGLCRSMIVPA